LYAWSSCGIGFNPLFVGAGSATCLGCFVERRPDERGFNPLFVGAGSATMSRSALKCPVAPWFQSPVCRGGFCNNRACEAEKEMLIASFNPLFVGAGSATLAVDATKWAGSATVSIPCLSGRVLQRNGVGPFSWNGQTWVSIPCLSGRVLQRIAASVCESFL